MTLLIQKIYIALRAQIELNKIVSSQIARIDQENKILKIDRKKI